MADARLSGRSYLRMLAVSAGLLTLWVVLFVAFFSRYYGVWGTPFSHALIWSAALAKLGVGGAAAFAHGHQVVGALVFVPVAALFFLLSGSPI